MKLSKILSIGPLLVLGGCMVGPDYQRPTAPVAQQFKEQPPDGWARATPDDAAPKGDWWTAFHDPLLDELEPQVEVSNQTVRQNYANYQQALAEVKVARAQLFPVLGLTASGTREGGSSSGASAARGVTTTTTGGTTTVGRSGGSVVNSGSLQATASWNLDIWGQIRRLIEENSALAQADEATLANATLSEQTLLANSVIELRLADANIDLQEKTVAAYKEASRVVVAQGNAGISATPPSAVITSQVQLENVEASLIGLGVARAQYAHAIAVLVGKNPEALDIPRTDVMPTIPEIPAGVPSLLLQRRPDIAAAERTMKAQNAAIGYATAAYYPAISLSGAAGFTQAPLDGLLHKANYAWSLGANATETIFDFGERAGEVAAARAVYDGSVASYRNTVLTAFQDVENDLSALRILQRQAIALDRAVADSIRGTQVAQAEFNAGTADYTTVALAQETQLTDQQNALTVQQSRLLAAVALISDLGGGWSDANLHDPADPKILPPDPSDSTSR
jgi:NodT family efflux transporter outer membrane factor (OMF) lipoprotein